VQSEKAVCRCNVSIAEAASEIIQMVSRTKNYRCDWEEMGLASLEIQFLMTIVGNILT